MSKLIDKFLYRTCSINGEQNNVIVENGADLIPIIENIKNAIFNLSNSITIAKCCDSDSNFTNSDIKNVSMQWNGMHSSFFSNLITILILNICGKNINDNFYDNFMTIEFKKLEPAYRPKYIIKISMKNFEFDNFMDDFNNILLKYKDYVGESYNLVNDYIKIYRDIFEIIIDSVPYDKYISYISQRKFKHLVDKIKNDQSITLIKDNIEKIKNGKLIIVVQ